MNTKELGLLGDNLVKFFEEHIDSLSENEKNDLSIVLLAIRREEQKYKKLGWK